jgi:hypothetical protein
MTTFSGKSENGSPIIGAKYWKKGTKIAGIVKGSFETSVGRAYNVSLLDEITVPGEYLSPPSKGPQKGQEWSIGALKGFEMALRAAGCGDLQPRDRFVLVCTGTEKTNKGNDRVNFEIEVTR